MVIIWDKSVKMAERVAVPTLDHEVPGSFPAGSGIQLMTIWHFSAQSLHYHPSIVYITYGYDLNNVESGGVDVTLYKHHDPTGMIEHFIQLGGIHLCLK